MRKEVVAIIMFICSLAFAYHGLIELDMYGDDNFNISIYVLLSFLFAFLGLIANPYIFYEKQ